MHSIHERLKSKCEKLKKIKERSWNKELMVGPSGINERI
jgi:hypothetical protein